MAKIPITLDPVRSAAYRRHGYWGDATLLDYWLMSARTFPDKTAVVDSRGTTYTFGSLDRDSDRLAAYLMSSGIEAGDVVSVQLPNWAEFTLIYIACLKVGAVINPLLPGYRHSELLHRLGKCSSKLLFVPQSSARVPFDYMALARSLQRELPNLAHIVLVDKPDGMDHSAQTCLSQLLHEHSPTAEYARVGADDVAVVLFTSGTESVGKGVLLTHNNLVANQKSYLSMTQLNCFDSMLMPVPVAHATGFMYGVTVPLMTGMKSVLLEKYDVDSCLDLIAQERCTAIEGPTVIAYDVTRRTDERPDADISSLRYFYCGGAPIPRTLVEKALGRGIRILGVYGSTESAPHCIVAPFHPPEKVLSTDGTPVPGTEVRVVDSAGRDVPYWTEGEELSRGPGVFMGYLGEPEMTQAALDQDGWYHSGDLCIMDDDGYVRITGRKKDVIIRGGENISSVEIEGILMLHKCIAEAAVVAYPDDRMGEKACAFLTLCNPDHSFDMAMLHRHMECHGVAKFKWPERLEFLSTLPRTETGKVKKFQLREDLRRKLKCEARHPCTETR